MWPPLWSSGQSSWLQIRRPGFDSRHYQKKSSGSGTGPTQPREYNWGATWYKSSGSCLENQEYGRRDPSRWPRGTLYPQKLAITSPTSGGRSVGIVRSRSQTMEFFLILMLTDSTEKKSPWNKNFPSASRKHFYLRTTRVNQIWTRLFFLIFFCLTLKKYKCRSFFHIFPCFQNTFFPANR
jgi:hypothetical protein